MAGKMQNRGIAEESKILHKVLGCSLAGGKTENRTSPKPDSATKMKGCGTAPQADDINGSAPGEESRQSIIHF
jgi:hypothetical protein